MIFNVGGNSEVVSLTAENVKYNNSNVAQELATLDQSVAVLEDELTANGKRIYLDYKDGKYGYNTSATRGADTFSPFKSGGSDWELLSDKIDIIPYGWYSVGFVFEVNDIVYMYYNTILYRIDLETHTLVQVKVYTEINASNLKVCRVNGNIYFYFYSNKDIYLFNKTDYSLTLVTENGDALHCAYTDKYIYEVGAYSTNKYFKRFNPVTNTWTDLSSVPIEISYNVYGSAFTHNNDLYVHTHNTIYKYDEVNNTWSIVASINSESYRESFYDKYSTDDNIHLIGGQIVTGSVSTTFYGKTDLVLNKRDNVFEYYSPTISLPYSIYEGIDYTYLLSNNGVKLELYRLKR